MDQRDVKGKLSAEKREIFNAIEQTTHELNNIAHDIWRYSEPHGQEHKSCERVTSFLKKKGFKISDQFKDFDTSFRAEFGEGETGGRHHPNIGLICEYSADPEMGHKRGYNLQTATSLAAAIGLQRTIKFSKSPLGMVTVIGCGSNETKTYKLKMQKAGFFHGLDFLLTAYPAPFTCMQPRFLAAKKMRATFKGRKASHNDNPWEEANPVNAAVITYQSVAALKAYLMPDWLLKGVIPKAGSDPCNLPETTTVEYQIKAPTERGLYVLSEKLHDCFEGAATATGCRFEEEVLGHTFISNINCPGFEEVYQSNAKRNGFTFNSIHRRPLDEDEISAISQTIATMVVYYYAGTGFKLDSDEFSRYSGSPDSTYMSIVQGKSLAMTGYDIMTKDGLMATLYEEHSKMLTKNQQEVNDPI